MYKNAICQVCGKEYYASPDAKVTMYCSGKCKTKAYRNRKKIAQMAKDKTLDMQSYQYQQSLMTEFPNWVTFFAKFRNAYGLAAYKDLLTFAVRCTEIVPI